MPIDVKLRLAKVIDLPATALGVPAVVALQHVQGGTLEDAEPFIAGPDDPKPPSHIAEFRMKTRALDEHPRRILPGHIVGMNINIVDTGTIESGTIVLAQLFDRFEPQKCYGTVVRQFIVPNKLITNSSAVNEMITLNDPASHIIAVIKGTLVYVLDRGH